MDSWKIINYLNYNIVRKYGGHFWGSFGHVEIYVKMDYFWNFEYEVFHKMASLRIIY
jgi:hypothetical protein